MNEFAKGEGSRVNTSELEVFLLERRALMRHTFAEVASLGHEQNGSYELEPVPLELHVSWHDFSDSRISSLTIARIQYIHRHDPVWYCTKPIHKGPIGIPNVTSKVQTPTYFPRSDLKNVSVTMPVPIACAGLMKKAPTALHAAICA